jgi:hypothetical protein
VGIGGRRWHPLVKEEIMTIEADFRYSEQGIYRSKSLYCFEYDSP